MKFQTKTTIPNSSFNIKYEHKILSLGSCFSVNVASNLMGLKYDILQNPCGITFNPNSILSCIKRCTNGISLLEDNLIQSGNLWCHYDFHGSFNQIDKDIYLKNANNSIQNAGNFMKDLDIVFITLGTAFVYRSVSTGHIVNNCHKLPSNAFNRQLLSVEEIKTNLLDIVNLIEGYSDKPVNFIFTLSPVRHIKDGLEANQKSKASCLLAIHALCDQLNNVEYFPSYEILLDELRDYRFYSDDMIHPSTVAVKYIFEKFEDCYLDSEEKLRRSEISAIQNSLNHRPLHAEDPKYLEFQQTLYHKIQSLEKKYPDLSFELEKKRLSITNS